MPRTCDITRRLLRHFDAADAGQRAKGERWYPDAQTLATHLERAHALTPGSGAGIIAALSPRVRWEHNVRLAHQLCLRQEIRCLGRSFRNAKRILEGERPGNALTGPKTRAFAACIRRPTNPWAICIDVWAARAAGVDPNKLGPPLYRQVAQAYRNAAKTRNISPATFQAVVWVKVRETSSRA